MSKTYPKCSWAKPTLNVIISHISWGKKYFIWKVIYSFSRGGEKNAILFPIIFLTLSYSLKINAVLCPERVYLPFKKRRDIFSEGNAAHAVRCGRPLADTVMTIWRTFLLNLNLLGRVWQPDADYNSCLALFKLKKKICAKRPVLSAAGCHT